MGMGVQMCLRLELKEFTPTVGVQIFLSHVSCEQCSICRTCSLDGDSGGRQTVRFRINDRSRTAIAAAGLRGYPEPLRSCAWGHRVCCCRLL